MEPTSPPKHASSLASRLNDKIEQDVDAVVRLTQKKLDALADNSSERLSASLNTTITDIEGRLKRLRKLSLWMWIVSLLTGAVLTLGMLVGLGLYGAWKLHQVKALEVREQRIQTALKQLPPPFRMIQSKGQWYLVAPQIDYTPRTDIIHGQKEDVVRIQP
jgi:hypothetical protein